MKYIIIDPIANSCGISSYTKSISKALDEIGIEYVIMSNDKRYSPAEFRCFVYKEITEKYGFDEIIIEAPEAKASTLLLPKEYNTHIRLHCPLAIAQKYDLNDINQIELSNELRVINKAKVVSSPSYGLLEELNEELDSSRFYVFKNPIPLRNELFKKHTDKKYDIVFMGRMQTLKGYDYIKEIIELLPSHYNVLVFGNNIQKLSIGNNYTCRVEVMGEIENDKRFDLISDSKVLMQLSRFENCSMVILESLAVGTPVVCWNVGGNAEIPSNKLIYPVTKNSIDELVYNIDYVVKSDGFPFKEYECAVNLINQDFKSGLSQAINQLEQKSALVPYKGINHSIENLKSVNRLISNLADYKFKAKRKVLGIAYSNEHVEELWSPIINELGFEYLYISRKPIGYHHVFEKKKSVCFNEKKYICFDWISESNRIFEIILEFKPDLILFHNGSHPSYTDIINKIKKTKIPILYSELGWLPQFNHVYFDCEGVNGKSSMAKMTFEEITKETYIEDSNHKNKKMAGQYHLVATQLDNDTNIIINSRRFKKRDSFVNYVLKQIKSKDHIILKLHPLDKKPFEIDLLKYPNVTLSTAPIENLLANAKSIISINSTTLIQALNYDCNIYYCGDSILDNKGVAQKFDKVDLSNIMSDNRFCSIENKKHMLDALKRKQLCLTEVNNMELNASSFDIVNLDYKKERHIELQPQDDSNLFIDKLKRQIKAWKLRLNEKYL